MTALYEIVPAGTGTEAPEVDPLKYQRPREPAAAHANELASIRVRYKAPDGDTSRLVTAVVRNRVQPLSANLGFASAVAEFGMLLTASEHRARASYHSAVSRARAFRGADSEGYRAEFVKLVDLAASLSGASREPDR